MLLPLELYFELAGVDFGARDGASFAQCLLLAWHRAAQFRPGQLLTLSLWVAGRPYHVGMVYGQPPPRVAEALWRRACAKAAHVWLAGQGGPVREWLKVTVPAVKRRVKTEVRP